MVEMITQNLTVMRTGQNRLGPLPNGAEPCRLCKRVIINAGIERVLTRNINGNVITYQVRNWINNEELEYGISLDSYSKELSK